MTDHEDSHMTTWSSRWAAMPSPGPESRAPFRSSSRTRPRRWATCCRCFAAAARIVITHGNGPQIGNILIRVEEGERRVPRLPLDTCVSDSQGGMGYMIQRLACEMFRREGIAAQRRHRHHPGAGGTKATPISCHPSKPIGSFYEPRRGRAHCAPERPHWEMREIEPGRWRRVVPSPRPLRILEEEAIACSAGCRRRGDRLRRRRHSGGVGGRPAGGRGRRHR